MSFHCITAARRSRVAFLNRSEPQPPPPRMWRGSGKLVWLALTGWQTRSHSRPPDKILLLQNQPTSRQGITCCLLLLWEPDFLVILFFFFLSTAFVLILAWIQGIFFKAYSSSSLASSASLKKSQMLWMWLIFLESILCFIFFFGKMEEVNWAVFRSCSLKFLF